MKPGYSHYYFAVMAIVKSRGWLKGKVGLSPMKVACYIERKFRERERKYILMMMFPAVVGNYR